MRTLKDYQRHWRKLEYAQAWGMRVTDDGHIYNPHFPPRQRLVKQRKRAITVKRRPRDCADPNCNGTCLRPGAILRDGLVLWPVHDWDIADRERDNIANGHG